MTPGEMRKIKLLEEEKDKIKKDYEKIWIELRAKVILHILFYQ